MLKETSNAPKSGLSDYDFSDIHWSRHEGGRHQQEHEKAEGEGESSTSVGTLSDHQIED
jgi:hypothetical protein